MSGVPDRLILLPKSKIAFAETKAPGEKPRQLQVSRHRLLRRLGFKVYVIDRKEDIEEVLDEIEGKKKRVEKPDGKKKEVEKPEGKMKEGGDAK